MEVILTNPTERELIRMRKDAEYDWNTIVYSAETRGEKRGAANTRAEVARGMKRDGIDPGLISKYTGLTVEEISLL